MPPHQHESLYILGFIFGLKTEETGGSEDIVEGSYEKGADRVDQERNTCTEVISSQI